MDEPRDCACDIHTPGCRGPARRQDRMRLFSSWWNGSGMWNRLSDGGWAGTLSAVTGFRRSSGGNVSDRVLWHPVRFRVAADFRQHVASHR